MAWIKNKEDQALWADGQGDIGGFVRVTGTPQTLVGPVYSPNGTQWFLSIDDLGIVIAVQAT